MLFTSYSFILFLIACFILYYILPKKMQWLFLLVVSYGFYAWVNPMYLIFIISTSITVYFTALMISKNNVSLNQKEMLWKSDLEITREEKKIHRRKVRNKNKSLLIICLLVNLGILAVLKYGNFVISNINRVSDAIGGSINITYENIILPLGISFYTFQALGYLLDVYWKKAEAQRNFLKFGLFVSFFPQLSQGPISRYNDLSATLYKEKTFDWKNVRFGLERILWGYFKKLVIADRLSYAVSMITQNPSDYTGCFVFIGMIFYAIQLYADFTGGIDITIGIAQVFGVKVQENFVRPFFAKSIAEYWRRWHISMGTWFKDYVFYPMTLSKPLINLSKKTRKVLGLGAAKRISIYVATIVTWLATGIWHGAHWRFVAWGLANGVIILISQELEPLYEKFHKRFPGIGSNWWYKAFQVGRTFLLMCSLRMFDNYQGCVAAAKAYINMFTKWDITKISKDILEYWDMSMKDIYIVIFGVICMFGVSMLQRKGSVRDQISNKPYIVKYVIFVALFFAIVLFGTYGLGYEAAGFIYNQF